MKKLLAIVLAVTLVAVGLGAGVASANPGCLDVDVTTSIDSGPGTVEPWTEETWVIEIEVCNDTGYTIYGVVVQDGMGADLDEIVCGTPSQGSATALKKTVGQGKHKMRATMVTWYVGTLYAGDCETLLVTVTTGENPNGYQEFTEEEVDHELDGGASASYWCGGESYESLESTPLTVDVEYD